MSAYTGKLGTYYAANGSLSADEREANARYIFKAFTEAGWTLETICGMLGNMQHESGLNPGRWQGGVIADNKGYGLVQWTPSTNFLGWAKVNGVDELMDGQIARILWELENGKQYYKKTEYPLTFREFSQSTQSAGYLAKAFGVNYERSSAILAGGDKKETSLNARAEKADYWYTFFGDTTDQKSDDGIAEVNTVTVNEQSEMINKIVSFAREQVGEPYVFAASGPDKWDCSGLTKRAAELAGYNWYHGATKQWNRGLGIKDSKCKDLPTWLGYWSANGTIDTLPTNKMAFLFNRQKSDMSKMAHTGIYDGNGNVIQAGGQYKGVSDKPLNRSRWTHWATLKGYDDVISNTSPPILSNGSEGEWVRTLQLMLNDEGAGLEVDGDFGPLTEKAVMAFQTKRGLAVDGIAGANTWAALMATETTEQSTEEQTETLYTLTYIETLVGRTYAEAQEILKRHPDATMTVQK